MITDKDREYLKIAIDQARKALNEGDEPFGSVLVSHDNKILAKDHNHVAKGDHTQHPEFNLARWAANNMTLEERAKATVYTSGEHCPMCAAAHGWVGLGRIVYASSSKQLVKWLADMGIKPGKVKNLSIQEVIRDTLVEGPVDDLAEEVHQLHKAFYGK